MIMLASCTSKHIPVTYDILGPRRAIHNTQKPRHPVETQCPTQQRSDCG